MNVKLILPWRYLVMLAVGLVILWGLIWRYGRNAPVLIGWLVVWLFVSRGVDFLMRRRRPRRPKDHDED